MHSAPSLQPQPERVKLCAGRAAAVAAGQPYEAGKLYARPVVGGDGASAGRLQAAARRGRGGTPPPVVVYDGGRRQG